MEAENILNNNQTHCPRREKVLRLLDYLTQFTRLRSKMIRSIDDYEKFFWVSNVPRERGCFTQAWSTDEEHEFDKWIEVQNRPEPEFPAVPACCEGWVDRPSLRKKNDLPELHSEITRQISDPARPENSDQPETIPSLKRLADYPEIQQAWDTYVEDEWLPWTEEHNTWEKVHEAYSKLFAIHQELRLGEEYELVLSLGLLNWQTPIGQRVRRHLIVADATLEFDARLEKFTVRPHTEGAKLRPELDMLEINEQPAYAEKTAKDLLIDADDNPWEKSCVEGALQALVHSINPPGDYDATLETKSIRASKKPIVEYAPALILRKRSAKGLTEILRKIKEKIESGENISGEFAKLAGIHPNNDCESTDVPEETKAEFAGEVFFPKPSNDKQRRIVDKIQVANGVLVQGPPGTGKSHTIANLICHLLATGQRTLITAKTPRALQVLENLVPSELRPLCINLLGSGLEERRSLESSVGGILRKTEEWDEEHAKREQTEFEEKLQKLREEKSKVDRQLREIRESETYKQSIAEGAYQGTAASIAKDMDRDRATYEWLTDSVSLNMTCPMTKNEGLPALFELRQFTPEKRQELGFTWPESLPSLGDFANLVEEEKSVTQEEQNLARESDERIANLLKKNNSQVVKAVHDAFSNFRGTQRKLLATSHSWMSYALRDILSDSSPLWYEFLSVTRDSIASIEGIVKVADEIQIEHPESTDLRSLYEDARKLKEHMENGGKLGWGILRPKLVKERLYVIKTIRVNGAPCSTVEHFSNLANAIQVRVECQKAWNFWKGHSKEVEGAYALQLAEFKRLRDTLERALALEEFVVKCREAMKECSGMDEPVWTDESQTERIVSSCLLVEVRTRKQLATEKIQSIEAPISQMVANDQHRTHSVTKKLLSAIHSRDKDSFRWCADEIQSLKMQHQKLQRLDEYLSKLRQHLPQFTSSLEKTCNNPHWEKRVQHIGDAWHWAQARYWIEDYIQQGKVPELTKRAKQVEDDINRTIENLASIRAWSFCFSRLEEDHRRHMEAWQHSMRRLGKGTGKHAPHHRREARKHLNKCREAVPAWVMPLDRVWDTVHPESGIFDVIIADESSQCGVEALPLFYLGKKILIVGDDKQISPEAVGLNRDEVHRLSREFLDDFEFKSSFDAESSLFDHGKHLYGNSHITLCEHFRCMPEIIRFSNDLCYSETPLIPLRQYGPDRLLPLDHVFVDGGHREGSQNRVINLPEAEAIVKRIAEMCGDSLYNDKTMGVVVLQGTAQADLIREQLLEKLGAEEMERRRLVCGNPYNFQGDERNIMFLSLVVATNEKIGPLTKPADERRFNVAASRACDKMILFHSVTCNDLSPSCLRRRLLDFFENTKPQEIAGIERNELERRAVQDNRSIIDAPTPFDSWFEVDVALELLRKGFIVQSQHKVADKRIDLVVEGGQVRLAVECDGDHWHGADRYEEDMHRQRKLERCGWNFFRVRESAFYANKKDALAGLWQTLEEQGILPNYSTLKKNATD